MAIAPISQGHRRSAERRGRTLAFLQRAPLWFISLAYLLVSLAATYPTILRLSTHLAAYAEGDALQHLWNSWWAAEALIGLGQTPDQATALYYPDGAFHPLLWVTPLPQLISLPLMVGLSPLPAYNIMLILTFFLAGLCGYLLCLELVRHPPAAFLGGLIIALYPNRVIHSPTHFAQVVTFLFPLTALMLLRLIRRPQTGRAVVAGVILALSLLVNIVHIAYMLIPLLALVLLELILRDGLQWIGQPMGRSLGLCFGIAALLCAPFLVPFLLDSLSGRLDYLSMPGSVKYAADLLSLFVPSPSHPLLARWQPLRDFGRALIGDGNIRENLIYAGLSVLVLAAIGTWRRWRVVRLWVLLALVGWIMSLGPVLKVGGGVTTIPLPYAALQTLPFYQWGRIPARANEATMLALGVLAAYGASRLLTRRAQGSLQLLLGVGLTALVLFDSWTLWPYPSTEAPLPSVYAQIAQEPGDFAVLHLPQLPTWERGPSNWAMYAQTMHRRPIVGGYTWRMPKGREGTMQALQELVWPPTGADIISRPTREEVLLLLNQYAIRYVLVVHGPWLDDDPQARTQTVALLGDPIYEDERQTLYRVPPASGTAPPLGVTALDDHWHGLEFDGGTPARWLAEDGSLYVHRLEPISVQLTFRALPLGEAASLEILVNDEQKATFRVEVDAEFMTPPFTLRAGENRLRFVAPDGCRPANEVDPGSQDARCLSFRIREIALRPAGS